LHWHLRPVHLWWLEKLVRLQEVRPNVASRGWSIEWYIPLAILIHLLHLVFNNNGLVDHVLEVFCLREYEGIINEDYHEFVQVFHKYLFIRYMK
jgi:hypothetical protein